MSSICFFISCNSSSRRAVLSSGPLDDRAERLSCLDDWTVLSGLRQLGWVELPALSSLCLLEDRVFYASLSLRRVTCRLSASWSSILFSLYGGGWLSSWGVGGPFRIVCHNSLFCLVISRARSWMLVAITCICLSIGCHGRISAGPLIVVGAFHCFSWFVAGLLFLGTPIPTDGANWWCQKSVGPFHSSANAWKTCNHRQ